MQHSADTRRTLAPVDNAVVRLVALLALALTLLAPTARAADPQTDAAGLEFFEQQIRPVLAEHCFKCHGPVKQFAELRLDSRKAMLDGGDTAPAIIPGNPDKSLLMDALRYGDVQMPPDGQLDDKHIKAFEHWIKIGAPWPAEDKKSTSSDARKTHWAFQPVKAPPLPAVKNANWPTTPVDHFVLAKLDAAGLQPSPPATRREWLRRVTYTLTGLPPTDAEVRAFEHDTASDARERAVDRLLASPQYGEHWGRQWLDVARYSDTKGYVYAREEKVFVHAPTYRDWVVQAFNDNLPFDQFIQLQIAADSLAPDEPRHLAALGFLTIGRRFLGVTTDIMDDRIDVVTRGLMGLTVSCARCHDHKYDPIPTADYYSLYGVFQNTTEKLVQIADAPVRDPAFEAEFEKRQHVLNETRAKHRLETADRVRARLTDYLTAQTEIDKYPEENFDIVIGDDDIIPAFVRRWETYIDQPERRTDPIFAPWTMFAALPKEDFAKQAIAVTASITNPSEGSDPAVQLAPGIRQLFEAPPKSMREVAERYGQWLTAANNEWQSSLKLSSPADFAHILRRQSEPETARLLDLLYGPTSPCVVPDEHPSSIERLCDSGICNSFWKVQGDVDRLIINSPNAPAFATILVDRDQPTQQHIYRRGNPGLKGDVVPRQFLKLLSDPERRPFSEGTGRQELARAIADPRNPLTARVWVNRVWWHHFGAGLVRTPSDFGVRAEAPSHPELLDWLADQFVKGGWNTKELHRQIVLSSAFAQESAVDPQSPTAVAALTLDPQNRLLWRMNPRRLSFEELRDTWLAVGGDLDLRMGGRSTDMFAAGAPHKRRTLYGYVDRQFVPDVLRMFDFANPDLHSPQRSETTVPQQALFAMNSGIVAERARVIASLGSEGDERQAVRQWYAAIYQREPTASQLESAVDFLRGPGEQPPPPELAGAKDWTYGYGAVDAEAGRVKSFEKLPHFTGNAWQGGPAWPDAKLGWVQITADGGHAGNDLAHAAIRRWTAPADATISVTSLAQHDVKAGDGVKCWIISSRHGVLASKIVHNADVDLNLSPVEVQAGDTLDFVVDYNANLNSDQHLWAPVLRELPSGPEAKAGATPRTWDAKQQFEAKSVSLLNPREQLVQVLLLANELMFVD